MMKGVMKLLKNRFFLGAVSLILAAAVCFVVLPSMYQKQASVISVVKVKESVPAGTELTSAMLTSVTVGAYGLDASVVTKPETVIGKVCTRDLGPRDYLYSDLFLTPDKYSQTVSAVPKLEPGQHLVSITVESAAAAVASLLSAGDVVDLYYAHTGSYDDPIMNSRTDKVDIIHPVLLQNMVVYSVRNSALTEVGTGEDNEDGANISPAVVTFIATAEQEQLLIYLEHSSADSIHMVLKQEEETPVEQDAFTILASSYLLTVPSDPVPGADQGGSVEVLP